MRGVEEEGVWPAECNNENAFQTTGCFSEEISSVSSPTKMSNKVEQQQQFW